MADMPDRRPKPRVNEEEYLGDGVYASFDGFQVWLRVPKSDGSEAFIALEPSVLNQLHAFERRIWPKTHPPAEDHG